MAETVHPQATDTSNAFASLTPHLHWLVRAVVGGTFVFHGIDKFGAGLENVAAAFGFPVFIAFLVAAGEVAAGLAVVAGGLPFKGNHWLTRLGGLAVAVIMLGAIAIVHWGQWAFAPSPSHPVGGMEYQSLLVVVGLFLAFKGNDF